MRKVEASRRRFLTSPDLFNKLRHDKNIPVPHSCSHLFLLPTEHNFISLSVVIVVVVAVFFVDFIFACFSLTHETSYINILWGQNFIHTLIIILLFLKSSVITTFMHLPLNKQDYSSRTLSLSSILQQVATTPKRREKKFKLKNKKKKISIKLKLPLSRADNKEVNWNVSNCVWKIFK